MLFYLAMTTRLPAIAALLGLTVSGCAATTGGTATPAAPAPMASAETLDTFLLLGGQVSAAFASHTDLVVTRDVTALWDDSAPLSDRKVGCLAVAGAAQRGVYADSGFTAMRGQVLREPQTADWAHFATQAVVLFPSAASAAAFFTRSREDWADCSNRELTYTQQLIPDQRWSVGPVSEDRDVLAVSRTQRSPQQWSCQRALTVHSNVAVDVEACSLDGPTSAASAMAREITQRLGPA